MKTFFKPVAQTKMIPATSVEIALRDAADASRDLEARAAGIALTRKNKALILLANKKIGSF